MPPRKKGHFLSPEGRMLKPRDKIHFSCLRRPSQANRAHASLTTVRIQKGKINTKDKEKSDQVFRVLGTLRIITTQGLRQVIEGVHLPASLSLTAAKAGDIQESIRWWPATLSWCRLSGKALGIYDSLPRPAMVFLCLMALNKCLCRDFAFLEPALFLTSLSKHLCWPISQLNYFKYTPSGSEPATRQLHLMYLSFTMSKNKWFFPIRFIHVLQSSICTFCSLFSGMKSLHLGSLYLFGSEPFPWGYSCHRTPCPSSTTQTHPTSLRWDGL